MAYKTIVEDNIDILVAGAGLGGYSGKGRLETKRFLLEHEGALLSLF